MDEKPKAPPPKGEPKAELRTQAELHTPNEWAKLLGQFEARNPLIPQSRDNFRPAHAAADTLYGWSQHAYDFQAQPFQLSRQDYEAALKAALDFPCCAPHAAALPPSQRERFKDFEPKKRNENSAKAKAAAKQTKPGTSAKERS